MAEIIARRFFWKLGTAAGCFLANGWNIAMVGSLPSFQGINSQEFNWIYFNQKKFTVSSQSIWFQARYDYNCLLIGYFHLLKSLDAEVTVLNQISTCKSTFWTNIIVAIKKYNS